MSNIEKNIRSCGRIKVSNIKSRRNWDSCYSKYYNTYPMKIYSEVL